MAYVYTYFMGFDLATSTNPSFMDKQLIPQEVIINGNIYFYGVTKRMWGDADTNRFPFVLYYDVADQEFGNHVATARMTSTYDSGPYTSGGTSELDGTYNLGVPSTDMSGTRSYTDLATSIFSIYEIDDTYLSYSSSNSFISSIDLGVDQIQYIATDGTIYEIPIPDPFTRTFEIDGSTCDADRADLPMYDHNGAEVTADTRPFWYDGVSLFFQSESEDDQGTFEWSTLGLSFKVTEDSDAIAAFLASQEESEADIAAAAVLTDALSEK
jgi:hypothetical protein